MISGLDQSVKTTARDGNCQINPLHFQRECNWYGLIHRAVYVRLSLVTRSQHVWDFRLSRR
jgi:hypothetical protein